MAKYKKCPRGMKVQSVYFCSKSFTDSAAKKWLREHGYKAPRADVTKNYRHYRQLPPADFAFGSIRTIEFAAGIKAKVGCPKKEKKSQKTRKNPTKYTGLKIPEVLVYLGRAVELRCKTWEYSWTKKDNFGLYANHTGTQLFIFPKPKSASKRKSDLYDAFERHGKKAENGQLLFETFTAFDPLNSHLAKISEKKLTKTDKCMAIVYASDKWDGKEKSYIHEFDTPAQVLTDKEKKPSIVALIGGKMSITPEGIVG